MSFQVLFLAALLLCTSASADCFDFKTKIVKPIKDVLKLEKDRDSKARGEYPGEILWAANRGVVKKSIQEVYKLYADHNTTKSSRADLEVKKLEDPSYLAHHQVHFEIHPFLFVVVEWTEEWVYALVTGTAANPKEIAISYAKIEGTSHIKHLCGSLYLRKLTADSTDVYQYEEVRASQRSIEDEVDGLDGTLKTLRK